MRWQDPGVQQEMLLLLTHYDKRIAVCCVVIIRHNYETSPIKSWLIECEVSLYDTLILYKNNKWLNIWSTKTAYKLSSLDETFSYSRFYNNTKTPDVKSSVRPRIKLELSLTDGLWGNNVTVWICPSDPSQTLTQSYCHN